MSGPAARRRVLLGQLAEQNLDGLVVTAPANVRYLSGFIGEGDLLVAPQPGLCTDRRYEVEAAEQAAGCRVVCAERGHLAGVMESVRQAALSRVGFEAKHLTFAAHRSLSEGLPECELVPTTDLVEGLRRRKDPEEIALIERAAALTDRVLADFLPRIRPGPTERRLAWDFRRALVDAGAEDASFTPILASGPRSALPHAEPTDRALQPGDILVVDVGARLEGYCSDLTRTLYLGEPPPEFAARYRAVRQAQEAGLAALAGGRPAAEVDQAARRVLEAAGLGEAFSHGLGHGVGLEIHEGPALGRHSQATLQVGHVVTIEPGVYFPGWGGIRLEDLVVLEESGPRLLTHAPKLDL